MIGRLVAVDYGERRIGLAVSDPTRMIATPAGFILRRAGKRPPIAEIVRRGVELEAVGFVLGLPLDAEGDETPRSAEVRVIAAEIEQRTGLFTRLVDEFPGLEELQLQGLGEPMMHNTASDDTSPADVSAGGGLGEPDVTTRADDPPPTAP